jgi:5-carboxyvanillate decarboxylase
MTAEATYRRVATEEAFVTQEIVRGWDAVLRSGTAEPGFRKMGETILADRPQTAAVHQRLLDIGAGRIEQMDQAGIDVQLLSLTAPGVQVFDTDTATRLATESNDALAEAIARFPKRLAGLAAVAPQDPEKAADEIARAKRLGLCGVIINSHTHGEYLDNQKFWPIFEAAEALDMPIYLHPREPSPSLIDPFLDYGLYFAGWGFAVEAGLHAMRLIMSTVFTRFPNLRMVLGHMGEGIPFWLGRIDNRYLLQTRIGAVARLPRLPSEYFLDNFLITTSGVTDPAVLRLCIDAVGVERILFAADYPYESMMDAVRFLDNAALSTVDKAKIYETNATKLFNLRA